MLQCGTDGRTITEDRATQPMKLEAEFRNFFFFFFLDVFLWYAAQCFGVVESDDNVFTKLIQTIRINEVFIVVCRCSMFWCGEGGDNKDQVWKIFDGRVSPSKLSIGRPGSELQCNYNVKNSGRLISNPTI